MRPFLLLLRIPSAVLLSGHLSAKEPAKLSAADYEPMAMGPWTVHIERSLEDYSRRSQALDLLKAKLAEVGKLAPPTALPELEKVPIWISRHVAPGACYHPSAGWLKDNGRVVEMARSIEIQNVDNFIDWSPTQPLMLLHELAHSWQDRVVAGGYSNPEVTAAYQAAVKSGIYEKVRHANGREERHYALTNPMEYFAECSEAYFGRNDFQPFDRTELKTFDPAGYQFVERMWKIPAP